MQMFKALGDETRLRILGLLAHGELCVCDIMEVLKLPQSTASRHLAYLKNSKWIYGTRRGKWMYYQFDTKIPIDSVHFQILQYLSGLEEVKADQRELVSYLVEKDQTTM
ncbi:MAG: metalloregulator ArsR/SmtB family transcription factor [Desulfovibrionaceae bacterium]|nr:metalloregulator ArsR/SmtB family transcription factor [Desulfovibrionaceae bacterium]